MENGNQRRFLSMLAGTFAPADNSTYQIGSPVTQDRAPHDLTAGQDTSSGQRPNIVVVNPYGSGPHSASTSAGTGARVLNEEATNTGVPSMQERDKFIRRLDSTLRTQALSLEQAADGPSGSQSSGRVNTRPFAFTMVPVHNPGGKTEQSNQPQTVPEENLQQQGTWNAGGSAAAGALTLPYDRGRDMGAGAQDLMDDDNAAGISRKRTRAIGQQPAPAPGQDAWYAGGNSLGAEADASLRPASPSPEDVKLLLGFSGLQQSPASMRAPGDPAQGFGFHDTHHQQAGGIQPQGAGRGGPIARFAAASPAARDQTTGPPVDLVGGPHAPLWPSPLPSTSSWQLAIAGPLDINTQPSEPHSIQCQIPVPVEIVALTFSQDESGVGSVMWGPHLGVFDPAKYMEKNRYCIRLMNLGPPNWVSRSFFEKLNGTVGRSQQVRYLRVLGPANEKAVHCSDPYSTPVNEVPVNPSATMLEALDDWLLRMGLVHLTAGTSRRGKPRAQEGAVRAAEAAARHAEAANASDSAAHAWNYAHRQASRLAQETESEDGSQLRSNDNSDVNALAAQLNAANLTTTSGATSDTTPTYGAPEPSAGEVAAASPMPGGRAVRTTSWQTPSGAPSPPPPSFARMPGGQVYSPYARGSGAAGRGSESAHRHTSRRDDGIEHSCSSSSSASQRNGESEDAGHCATTPATPGQGMPLHMPNMAVAAFAMAGGTAASPAGTTCTGLPAGPASGTIAMDHDVSVGNCSTPTTSAARDTAGTLYNRAIHDPNAVTSAGEGARRQPVSAMTQPQARAAATYAGYPPTSFGWHGSVPPRPPHGPPPPAVPSTSSSGPQSSGDTSSGSLGRPDGLVFVPGTSSLSQPPPHQGQLPLYPHGHRRVLQYPMSHLRGYPPARAGIPYRVPSTMQHVDTAGGARVGGPIRVHEGTLYRYPPMSAPYPVGPFRPAPRSMPPTLPVDITSSVFMGATVLATAPTSVVGHGPRMAQMTWDPRTGAYGQMGHWPAAHARPGPSFVAAAPQHGLLQGTHARPRAPEGTEGGPQ